MKKIIIKYTAVIFMWSLSISFVMYITKSWYWVETPLWITFIAGCAGWLISIVYDLINWDANN